MGLVAGLAKLQAARTARLATRGADGWPHVVPVCFVYHEDAFYTPLDGKPKRTPVAKLARVRNIGINPEVALLVDQYDEDWTQLWYILVRGHASILKDGAEHAAALRRLRDKYAQYSSAQLLPDDAPVIRIVPVRITSWGRI